MDKGNKMNANVVLASLFAAATVLCAGASSVAAQQNEPVELRAESHMSSRTKDPKRDPGIFGDYWWANRFLSRHQAIEKVKGGSVDVVLLGQLKQLIAMSGHQFLVGSADALACLQ